MTETKYYRVDMYGDEPGWVKYQFSGSRTLEEAYEGIKNWMGWRPELKYYKITEFVTVQTLIEDTQPDKSVGSFFVL